MTMTMEMTVAMMIELAIHKPSLALNTLNVEWSGNGRMSYLQLSPSSLAEVVRGH